MLFFRMSLRATLFFLQYRYFIDSIIIVITNIERHLVSLKNQFGRRTNHFPQTSSKKVGNTMENGPAGFCCGTVALFEGKDLAPLAVLRFAYGR